MPINTNKANKTKIRCFVKKKYVCLFNFSATMEEVEEKENNNPNKKSKNFINLFFSWIEIAISKNSAIET